MEMMMMTAMTMTMMKRVATTTMSSTTLAIAMTTMAASHQHDDDEDDTQPANYQINRDPLVIEDDVNTFESKLHWHWQSRIVWSQVRSQRSAGAGRGLCFFLHSLSGFGSKALSSRVSSPIESRRPPR